jgi:hypothetical protein
MIIKTKVKFNRKENKSVLIVWIQKHKDLDEDIQEILNFFKGQIRINLINRIHQYYKISSTNPAIMLSLTSAIQDLITESYFNIEEPLDLQELANFEV